MEKLVYDTACGQWSIQSNDSDRDVTRHLSGWRKRMVYALTPVHFAYALWCKEASGLTSYSDNFHQHLGIDPHCFSFDQLMGRVHQDDCENVVHALEAANELAFEDERLDEAMPKVRVDFRFKSTGVGYRRILMQLLNAHPASDLETNQLLMVFSDITALRKRGASRIDVMDNVKNLRMKRGSKDSSVQPCELPFSRREAQMLKYLAKGMSSKEIAAQFTLSEATVINHRKRLLKKTDTASTAELVVNTLQDGYF